MAVDVSLLRQFSTETLTSLLRQIQGEKDLVIEGGLMKPLDKIAAMSLLKGCGVKKVFKFDQDLGGQSTAPTRVYFLPSSLAVAKKAIGQLKSSAWTPGLVVHLIFIPKALQSIHILIEEEGMFEKLKVGEFMWQLLPLDADLLSLELPAFFPECICRGDLYLLGTVSKTLFNMECLYGRIPNRVGLGRKSNAILAQLELLESSSSNFTERKEPEIGHVIVMDRDYDFASCLLSPVTYEALLDEVFGISCGAVNFSQSEAGLSDGKLTSVRLELSTRDRVFENIRFKHFATIFGFLSNNAKQVRQSQTRASSMNVTEMKAFVQQNLRDLQQHSKAVSIHVSASEVVQSRKGYFYENLLPLESELVKGVGLKDTMAFLERAISTLHPIEVVLRLLCLASCCLNGLSPTDYNKMKKLICDAYGFKHLATLAALSSTGLLKEKSSLQQGSKDAPPSFPQLAQKLELIPKPEAANSLDRSPAAVFNNIYLPVVCKVVKTLLESPTQLHELARSNSLPNSTVQWQKPGSSKNVLIFFVGGYTLAETAALKSLQSTSDYHFLIAGTCNITGKTVINSVINEA